MDILQIDQDIVNVPQNMITLSLALVIVFMYIKYLKVTLNMVKAYLYMMFPWHGKDHVRVLMISETIYMSSETIGEMYHVLIDFFRAL
jgi:hypothetical protein